MALCSCHKDVNLQLGFSSFEESNTSDEEEDPLVQRFKDEKWSFQNPVTKQSEQLSVMEVIENQSHVNNCSGNGEFRMFPPIILPKQDLAHGFPRSVAQELSAKDCIADGKESKHKKDVTKPIEDTLEFKRSWLQASQEHFAETTITQALASVFTDRNSRGFMIQSYHTVTYLQPLIKLAWKQRENAAKTMKCDSSLLELSRIEKNICLSLGIKIDSIEHKDDLNIEDLKRKLTVDTSTKRKKILEVFEDAKKKYKDSNSDQKKYIAYQYYHENVNAITALETDLMIVLEKEKLVIHVETKSKEELKVKTAAGQLRISKKVFQQCHKDILDSSWRFVSVIALPFIEDKEVTMKAEKLDGIICASCKDFIIDHKDKIGVRSWVENTLECSKPENESAEEPMNKRYKKLYNRIIGFMSVSTTFGVSSNVFFTQSEARQFFEEQILVGGEKSKKEVSGKEKFGKGITCEHETGNTVKQENISERLLRAEPLSSLQLLYFWSEEQLQFIVKEDRKVLFLGDFGVGKTLMMKYMALKLSSQKTCKTKVVYISFASARRDSNHKEFHVSKFPSIFDIANEIDFEGTSVDYISIADLLSKEDSAERNPMDILKKFMEENQDCHVFIDELPVSEEVTESEKIFVEYLENYSHTSNFLWITFRLCDVHESFYDKCKSTINFYKDSLQKIGFIIPQLKHNMRNSSNVFTTFDSIYGQGKEKLTVSLSKSVNNKYMYDKQLKRTSEIKKETSKQMSLKVLLPNNTVDGVRSVIIPVPDRDRPVDTLPYIISTYFNGNEEEPIVILLAEAKFLPTAEKSLSSTPHRVLMFDPSVSSENIRQAVKNYLQNPSGILLTEAEAFNGMQARNVVVVAKRSTEVRNYILRGISFVIFVQKRGYINSYIYHDSSVHVDKSFLPAIVAKNDLTLTAKR